MVLTILKLGLIIASLVLVLAAVSALLAGEMLTAVALLALTFLVVLLVTQLG